MRKRLSIYILCYIICTCLMLYTWLPSSSVNSINANLPYKIVLTPNDTHPSPSYHAIFRDSTNLIDLKDFRYILNNSSCDPVNPPLVLMLVHSAPNHVANRNVIRATWGGRNSTDLSVLFLIGDVATVAARDLIAEENRHRRDIVQGNFLDSYRNLTYKHVMALKWATHHCAGVTYVLKLDDDVFVNTPHLFKHLSTTLSPYGVRRLMMCPRRVGERIQRGHRSKWRVSPLEYPGSIYPPYCFGWAIIYSPDVVRQLYEEAQTSSYFWIDDVHVTGVLAARRNLTQIDLGALVMSKNQFEDFIAGRATFSPDSFLFGPPNLSIDDITQLWKLYEKNLHLF